jgi:predicted CoA-binding protein
MKTLVIGAGTNPDRYAYKAVVSLRRNGHEVVAFGKQLGAIGDVEIETSWNTAWEIDTVTLYINPVHQVGIYDQILALQPRRVIFNPGTENPEFENLLTKNGILSIEACTLVMLSIGNY